MLLSSLFNGTRLTRNIRRAFRLTVGERTLLMRAVAWFPAVEVGLRLFPLRRLLELFQWGAHPDAVAANVSPERAGRLVEAASRMYPFGPTCLKKALVLYALLRRRGLKVQLLLGTAKENGELKAHAWVEHDGAPISAVAEIDRYARLCSLDHALG